ncbi:MULTISPECIES: e9imm peptide [unclassified Streptomyces]|uniref:e9imm peptide n=1 Tax=unclassified Streptomyces TaxID=2593676 RepID=UPI002E2B1991|nr:e9imm peptide [Streptomyces sp. NBC_00272]
MTTQRSLTRDEAVLLVQRLLDGDATEPEADKIIATLQRGLACPHISNYMYWDFDPALSAEKVVDRAMAYKPIAL